MSDANDTRSIIELARENVVRNKRRTAQTDPTYAQGMVDGYDLAEAAFERTGVRDYSGALAMANARVAELEAQLAASEKCSEDRTVGVVVDDEMMRRFSEAYFRPSAWDNMSQGVADSVKHALTAALRTARTVPLRSGEPVWWRDDDDNLWGTRETALEGCRTTVTPLYAGLAEPAQRGEGSNG